MEDHGDRDTTADLLMIVSCYCYYYHYYPGAWFGAGDMGSLAAQTIVDVGAFAGMRGSKP